MNTTIRVGNTTFNLSIENGELRSLGDIRVHECALRNPANRFLPWFDSYAGDPFTRFHLNAIDTTPSGGAILHTTAISNPDAMFLEKRDCSGDPVLRQGSWDATPAEATFDIHLEPAETSIDSHSFSGFRYWFTFDSPVMPLHRILDRQTWEIGGTLEGVHVVCRNLFDLPCKRLGVDVDYSTVGLDNWAGLLPGNLWGRWSLLPPFDMQYGEAGILLAWFDQVSCIRSVIESRKSENWLRVIDLHYFEQTNKGRTNPKTILFSSDKMDHTDALNLWTRMQDVEQKKACVQFGIAPEEPPAVIFHENHWKDFHFDTSYEHVVEIAEEFHADQVFIDPVWQNGEALRQRIAALAGRNALSEGILGKLFYENMCCSYDFEVAEEFGGEKALAKLCERAQKRGIAILSWMALHYSPRSAFFEDNEHGDGAFGVFAAKESGRHPDTGYAANCWPVNLNAPIADKIREQLLGVCQRTGLKGYLWDSFSNLGWWQIDYSSGTMRPQVDKLCKLYADLVNQGLYIIPEALVSFSSHSCCGLHGGNVYAGELLGYSYNTMIDLRYHDTEDCATVDLPLCTDRCNRILRGVQPIDELFQCVAHKRIPPLGFQKVPREEWNEPAAQTIKELINTYKTVRNEMQVRTVLKDNAGTLWENGTDTAIFFSFKRQKWSGRGTNIATGQTNTTTLEPNTIYRISLCDRQHLMPPQQVTSSV